ncbi:MAG: methyltransferase domain-containing protein [Candidatus Woesearchaeota archaeon]
MKQEWWDNNGGFFGIHYIIGDYSIEGYIPGKKETLEQRTQRESEGVVNLLKLKKESNILDCPCGYGRHSIALAKKEYNVKGIDISWGLLKYAISDAERFGLEKKALFEIGDMRDLGEENYNRFDAVINMFYSFGFFEEEDNVQTMQEFYNALKEDGQFLLHTDISPEMILKGKDYKLSETRNLTNGKRINGKLVTDGKLIIKEKYNHKTKRITGSWVIEQKDDWKDELYEIKLTPYSVRIYSKEEFDEMAKGVGFKETKFYGSFKGEDFTKDSKELIMVAKK